MLAALPLREQLRRMKEMREVVAIRLMRPRWALRQGRRKIIAKRIAAPPYAEAKKAPQRKSR